MMHQSSKQYKDVQRDEGVLVLSRFQRHNNHLYEPDPKPYSTSNVSLPVQNNTILSNTLQILQRFKEDLDVEERKCNSHR